MSAVTFRAFRQFNDPQLAPLTGLRKRLDRRALPHLLLQRDEPTITDRLRDAGDRVEWSAIPAAVTEKSRIIIAVPNAGEGKAMCRRLIEGVHATAAGRGAIARAQRDRCRMSTWSRFDDRWSF